MLDLAFTPVTSGSYPGAIISLEGMGAVPCCAGEDVEVPCPSSGSLAGRGHRHAEQDVVSFG